jgi:hypothetical protein
VPLFDPEHPASRSSSNGIVGRGNGGTQPSS